MAIVLGIDVGTSGLKALLVDEEGAVHARATSEYSVSTPKPLWSEQDPESWWRATLNALAALREQAPREFEGIAAVGLTGQMHGLVLLDAAGTVIRPGILWNDQRTAEECAILTARVGASEVIRATGNPILTGFTAPKLLWVERHEPEHYARIAHVLLPKDFIRYRLTGECVTDVADASGTSWLDVGARSWSAPMIDASGVDRAWLPRVDEGPDIGSAIEARAADATGLRAGTPVVAGAGDQAAQALGSGIVEEGQLSCTLGTSGVVFAASSEYRTDPEGRLHAFAHAVPGAWHLMGVMLSAGGALQWYRDRFGPATADAYERIAESAATAPPGCEGLTFLPYLTGERTPHANPEARAAFVGLTQRHERSHLDRAVFEGITFGLRDSLELIRALGISPRSIRLSGGGARSSFWRQLIADAFETTVVPAAVDEGAAYGAALLALAGASPGANVANLARGWATAGPAVEPSGTDYSADYQRFRDLYPRLHDRS